MIKAPLQWIELSRKALENNVTELARLAGRGRMLALSVKSNAYGHGLDQIVSLLAQNTEVEYLSIHSLEEAEACRQAGWTRKLLLLGPFPLEQVTQIDQLQVEPVICTLPSLEALGELGEKTGKPILSHLKLETGTNRQGIKQHELPAFATIYRKYQYLQKPYGASTHFANIEDTTNHEYGERQLAEFHRMLGQMKDLGIEPTIRHAASSAAMILFDKTRFEMVRPGLSLYGYWPSKETYLSYTLAGGDKQLFSPLLSWRTRITQLKDLEAGSFVGYGITYRTPAAAKLAVLPVGYADGYSRAISGRGHVLINGHRAPLLGRICMNLCMVEVTHVEGVSLGDEVTLIGKDGEEEIKTEQLAEWSESIHYEILARLSPTIPRRLID